MSSSQLRLSPGGDVAAIVNGTTVRIVCAKAGVESVVSIDVGDSVALFDGELWVVGRDRLRRLHLDGTVLAEVSLPASTRPWEITPASTEPTALLWGDACVIASTELGQLVLESLAHRPSAVAWLGARRWLRVDRGKIELHAHDSEIVLPAAPPFDDAEVVTATSLYNGWAFALLLAREGQHEVVVLDARSGNLQARTSLGAVDAVRFVANRGQVLTRRGARIDIYDLRFGRRIRTLDAPDGMLDVAVDRVGRRLAWLLADPARSRLQLDDYRSLISGAIESQPPPHPAPSTNPPLSRPVEPAPPGSPGSPSGPLRALGAEELPTSVSGPAAVRCLEKHLQLVGAWCLRAIISGWDTGRLAFPRQGAMPFQHEVDAMLEGKSGLAAERLAQSELRVAEAEASHDAMIAASLSWTHAGDVPPLVRLAVEFDLSRAATDVLLVVAAPTIWGELARLYGIIANDRGRSVCDELLVAQVLAARAGRREIAVELLPHAPLVRHGLIAVGAGAPPFASLQVHPLIRRRLYGERFEGDDPDESVAPRDASRSIDEMTVAVKDLSRFWARLQQPPRRGPTRVVVRGRRGSGRTTILANLAARVGRRLGVIDARRFAPGRPPAEMLRDALERTVLRGWLPCVSGIDRVSGDHPEGRDEVRAVLRAHPGPMFIRAGVETDLPLDPGYIDLELGRLREGDRIEVWTRALARHDLPSHAASLAARHEVGPGIVESVCSMVAERIRSQADTDDGDLQAALEDQLRQHRDNRMGAVASRITRLPTWDQLVLPPEVIDSIREFVGRVADRRTVFDRWGFDRIATSARGLTALFEGLPGTGKSMVAGVIAKELGFDLYRVDLAKVLSKWIGETEQNLAAVFDAAEEGNVILLFDEADSLFGKRTETQTANDRYANLQVNYLLQRFDSFEGIAILTTNLGKSVDPAFKRRLSLRLRFPFPDEEMREQLWRVHLPREMPIAGDLDLTSLARRLQLSGGYIRNIALRAAFLAARDRRPLMQEHIERAVSLEYTEMGKLVSEGSIA